MLGARAIEHRPFFILGWGHDWFSASWLACRPLLRWKNEVFQVPLPPCPLVSFSSYSQLVQSWRVEVAKKREEEI